MTFEEKTNKVIKHLMTIADNDYNPLTVNRDCMKDITDWLMYVSTIQIERIKRERES